MISKPIQVKAISQFIIYVKYADGTEGQIDLSHLITKPLFKNWLELEYFNKVYIDNETLAISWDENIELCPDNMYLKIRGISFEQWKTSQYSYATSQ
ncbi:MAG: DUF2442 domain-containing protein [Mariniphaga sp.]